MGEAFAEHKPEQAGRLEGDKAPRGPVVTPTDLGGEVAPKRGETTLLVGQRLQDAPAPWL